MRNWRKRTLVLALVVLILLIIPGLFRVYVIAGRSDAPSLVLNDRVIVNRAAYDCTIPYTYSKLFSWGQPARGDMVLIRMPGRNGAMAAKRIVAVPGDTVELRDNLLAIDGRPLAYEQVDRASFEWVGNENQIGSEILVERGDGYEHHVTFTPGRSPLASFGPVVLGEDEYFVLGDNRDDSRDSRSYGPVPRREIYGKVVRVLPFRTAER